MSCRCRRINNNKDNNNMQGMLACQVGAKMRSWEVGSGSGRMGDHPTGVKSERSSHLYCPGGWPPEEVQI